MVLDPTCGFCLQNSDFWTRITSLYGSQTWPVILCICHSVISTRITRLYGSQPSSVVFACKTATFGPEYKSLRVPDLTCRFVYAKRRDLHKNKKSIWVPALTRGFCILNSDFRTRITSLCRRIDPTCCFCMQNSYFWTRITSLYGSQTSPVIFCLQNSVPSFRITSLYGSQSSSVFLHSKQRLLDPNNKSLWVPDITCRFVQAIQRN